jgi:hypothetical protein
MGRWPQAALVALWLAFPITGRAIEEWESEDGNYTLELMGSARLLGAFLHYPDIPIMFPEDDDALVASVTRLMMEGDLGEITQFEVNAFLELSRMPAGIMGGAFSTAGAFPSPYRSAYLTGEFWESGTVIGAGGIDRIFVSFDLEPVTLSVGRLPVNYSVTNIFTPNDFFAPFSVVAVNTMYKPGVDTLRLAVTTGMFSSVELVGVLGSDEDDVPSWGQSALMLHARTVVEEVELSLLGGKVAERWVAGASLQAAADIVNIRAEGHVGFPDTDGDFEMDDIDGDGRTVDGFHARLSTGMDVMFTWHNSTIGAEYMYLSDGARSTDRYFDRVLTLYPDDPTYLGRHYLGFSLGTEIIPILRTMGFVMVNAEDGSGIFTWNLMYNISDEADAILGVMIPFGKAPVEISTEVPITLESEYGQLPINGFVETRFYF